MKRSGRRAVERHVEHSEAVPADADADAVVLNEPATRFRDLDELRAAHNGYVSAYCSSGSAVP